MSVVQIQLRHDTASNWTSANPTLLSGEIGIETDTNKYKIGDGSTAWSSLAYVIALPSQTGNSGKYLTTDGSTASWSTIAGDIESVTAGTGLSGGGTSGAITINLDTASAYVVPSQSGNSGKYLTTDGSTSSWATVGTLPSQTGNSGKYLTTDGSTASWTAITTDPIPQILMLGGI